LEIIGTIGLSIAAFILVLGIMIFIHELGHYLVAKYLGIRVDVFSLGFGPRLFGFRRGETDYRVSVLPLGGYVKMAGEHYEENLSGSPDEFLSRPKSHRFAVAIAGPLMNIGLAIFLIWVMFIIGMEVPSYARQPAAIGKIEQGSPAERANLQLRDVILSIDGRATPTWRDVELEIAKNPNQPIILEVERDGRVFRRSVTTGVDRETGEIGVIGIAPFIPYIINRIEPGSPAAQAGLRPGDEIIRVGDGDRSAVGFFEIPELISQSHGQPLNFEIRRDGAVFHTSIAPVQMNEHVRIGIEIRQPTHVEQYGPVRALFHSLEHNYRITVLTFEVIGRIITGRTSMRAMTGPIGIARYSGVAASQGFLTLLAFMALISLNLGIFNLLPIPILDGGVIALLAIEAIAGRDLSLRVKERILQIGFLFLILLMGIVIFNDITRHLPSV
jgi:regulator of sigma E protease